VKFVWRVLLLLVMVALLTVLCPDATPLPGAYAETEALAPLSLDADAPVPDAAAYLPDNAGYADDSLSVSISTMREFDTDIMVAKITVKDASQLRTAMAAKFGSTQDIPGAKLAKRVNAVFAINGDYFNFDSTGYVLRQGTLYRDNPREDSDVLLIDDQGDFHAVVNATSEKIAAVQGTIVNALSFGPALVVDGQAQEINARLLIAPEKETQRMVLAQTGPLSYLCVATEGPENPGSRGLTLKETAQLMVELGAVTAYNLDGGSSSTMVLNNAKINALSTHKVRPICDIVYFATLCGTR